MRSQRDGQLQSIKELISAEQNCCSPLAASHVSAPSGVPKQSPGYAWGREETFISTFWRLEVATHLSLKLVGKTPVRAKAAGIPRALLLNFAHKSGDILVPLLIGAYFRFFDAYSSNILNIQ